jgi:hypothetical protein
MLALSVIVDSLFDDAQAVVTVTRSQTKINSCIGFAQCGNTGTITFGLGGGRDSHP